VCVFFNYETSAQNAPARGPISSLKATLFIVYVYSDERPRAIELLFFFKMMFT